MRDGNGVAFGRGEGADVEECQAVAALEDLRRYRRHIQLRQVVLAEQRAELAVARAVVGTSGPHDADEGVGRGRRQRGDLDRNLARLRRREAFYVPSADGDLAGERFDLIARRIDDAAAARDGQGEY